MARGNQAHIARAVGIKPQTLNDYLAGRSSASAPIADQLAALTNTDIRIWLKGGDTAQRREAVDNRFEVPADDGPAL